MMEPDIHFETLAVANFILTKKLLARIVSKELLNDEEIAGLFASTAEELIRSTLPISREGAKQALSLFLAGSGIDIGTVWPDH
ncbi:MAG: hypothetical protein AB1409_08100 [Pseudomonadota bacterium]